MRPAQIRVLKMSQFTNLSRIMESGYHFKNEVIKKAFLLFTAFCISVASIFAQDVITLKNGEEIQSLVQEIGDADVKYKKFDNPDGPNYTLKKAEIFMVKYANGSRDVFADNNTSSVETTKQAAAPTQTVKSKVSNSSLNSNKRGWHGVSVSYHPITIHTSASSSYDGINESASESVNANGLSIGYAYSCLISSQVPVFIESGINFQWINDTSDESEKNDYWEYKRNSKFNLYSIRVPLNIGYKLAFDEKSSFFAFAGLYARGNLSGRIKGNYSYSNEYGEFESDVFNINIFDKNDMDGETYNRFQFGWQAGGGFSYSNLYVSASYGKDFNNLYGVSEKNEYGSYDIKTKISTISITLGLHF